MNQVKLVLRYETGCCCLNPVKSKLEECSQALHAATQEREELRVQCESLLVTVTSLTQTISELEANSSRKEQSLLDLKEQYSCLATGFMEKEASFAHQITTLTTELCATEEKMAVAMRAVEEKNKRIEELQIEFVELEASLKSQISQNQLRHDEEVEQFKAMLEKLNQQACETSRVMEEKLLTESSNKALIAQLSFDLAAAKSDLKQAEATADELKIELAKVTGAMEKVLAERKTEVLALDTQIEALNETILSMERKLGHQGTIIAELNQRQEEVGRELSEKIQYADFLEAELKRHLVDADQEQEKSREVVVQFTTAQQELETSRDTCEELHELLKSALEREKNLQNKQRLLEQEFESERKRWQQELEYYDETVISQQSQQFSQKQKPIYAEECHLDVVATNWEDTGSQVDLIPETVVEPLLSGLAEKIETATTSAVSRKRSKQQRKVRIFDGKYWVCKHQFFCDLTPLQGMEVTAREGKGFLEEQGTLAYSPGSPRPRNFRFVDEKTGSPYKIHKSVLVSLKTYSYVVALLASDHTDLTLLTREAPQHHFRRVKAH